MHPGPQLYSPESFAAQRRALASTWQFVRRESPGAAPWTSARVGMEGVLLNGDRAYANVCTHRGAVLLEPGSSPEADALASSQNPRFKRSITCPYHGRRFGPDGRLKVAPGCPVLPIGEDLAPLAVTELGPWTFARLAGLPLPALGEPRPGNPALPDVTRWVAGVPLDTLSFVSQSTYTVRAHWALWVENYLEGLHVPFVHRALARTLDLARYRTLVEDRVVVQIGASTNGPFVPLPAGHPAGVDVAGLYLYLFPCTALNIYAWGVSVNVVEPISAGETRIHYERWAWPESGDAPGGPGGALDDVELEDDAIVERVARGVDSLIARGGALGSYAPGWEDGTRAFHAWLTA